MICKSCGQRVPLTDRYCVYCREKFYSMSAPLGAFIIAGLATGAAAPMFLFRFALFIPCIVIVFGFILALRVFWAKR
jgi:hypothetical protein